MNNPISERETTVARKMFRGPSDATSANLTAARANKNDEFYTRFGDIEGEVMHYRDQFAGKTVYLNCDDPHKSNFFQFFANRFADLKIERLIATCYKTDDPVNRSTYDVGHGMKLDYNGREDGDRPTIDDIITTNLEGDGSFDSPECIALLEQADIVVTNPPFSLFGEYIQQLVDYDKQFLVVGNRNAVSTKAVFPHIQSGKMWLGREGWNVNMDFHIPEDFAAELVATKKEGTGYRRGENGEILGTAPAVWFTNMDHGKRHEKLELFRKYDPKDYPTYDNFDGIEVSHTNDIPKDYDGVMGVPISFLGKWNPNQFEIVGITKGWDGKADKIYPPQFVIGKNGVESGKTTTAINGCAVLKIDAPIPGKICYRVGDDILRAMYPRLLIRRV